MKKYFTSLNVIFALEIFIVFLTTTGLVPREAVLFLTGLIIFFIIFSPVENSLWLVVASIPLFVALPIFEKFDSMANWRILIAVLFLVLFFKKRIDFSFFKIDGKTKLKHYALEYLALIFLLIGVLSIFVAGFKILAVKKLLFLINIFLLFSITRNLTRNKESILKIWQAAAAGGIIVIAVSLIQFLAVLFVPLFNFWQYWAQKVIAVFYGTNLAYLLSYSNTWFAYYTLNPPTLRLFSLFPDSHSLAMFSMILVPIFSALALFFNSSKNKKIFLWLGVILSLFNVVFSGSRGAWLSIVPVLLVAFYLYFYKIQINLTKKALLSFIIFVFIFIISVGYPPLLYKFQSWQAGGEYSTTTFSFFERAKSISDTQELSNKGRLQIWKMTFKSLKDHPVLGVGLGNYVKVLEEDSSAAKKGASAHNLYFDIASEIGIFGLLIFVLMGVDILYTSWLVFRSSPEIFFRLYGLFFGLYFIWILGYSFFDVVLLNDKVFLFFMVALATLYSVRNISFSSEKT